MKYGDFFEEKECNFIQQYFQKKYSLLKKTIINFNFSYFKNINLINTFFIKNEKKYVITLSKKKKILTPNEFLYNLTNLNIGYHLSIDLKEENIIIFDIDVKKKDYFLFDELSFEKSKRCSFLIIYILINFFEVSLLDLKIFYSGNKGIHIFYKNSNLEKEFSLKVNTFINLLKEELFLRNYILLNDIKLPLSFKNLILSDLENLDINILINEKKNIRLPLSISDKTGFQNKEIKFKNLKSFKPLELNEILNWSGDILIKIKESFFINKDLSEFEKNKTYFVNSTFATLLFLSNKAELV